MELKKPNNISCSSVPDVCSPACKLMKVLAFVLIILIFAASCRNNDYIKKTLEVRNEVYGAFVKHDDDIKEKVIVTSGENKNNPDVMNNLIICGGCKAIIAANAGYYN